MKKIFESTYFKSFLLVSLVILELYWGNTLADYGTSSYSFGNLFICDYHLLLIIFTIMFGLTIIWGCFLHSYELPGIQIVKRFFTNSAGKNKLAICLLAVFIMNFTWLIDSSYNLLFISGDFWKEVCFLLINIISIFIVLLICPRPLKNVPLGERKMIITSASLNLSTNCIEKRNVEGLFNILNPEVKVTINQGQEVPSPDITKYHIIPSKELLGASISEEIFSNSDSLQKIKNYNEMIHTGNSNDEVILKELAEIYKAYVYEKFNREVSVVIHSPINYNDDPNISLKTLDEILKNLKGSNHAIVAISQGTSIITSILSMIAIQGNRMIMYTRQDVENEVIIYDPEIQTISEYLEERDVI